MVKIVQLVRDLPSKEDETLSNLVECINGTCVMALTKTLENTNSSRYFSLDALRVGNISDRMIRALAEVKKVLPNQGKKGKG